MWYFRLGPVLQSHCACQSVWEVLLYKGEENSPLTGNNTNLSSVLNAIWQHKQNPIARVLVKSLNIFPRLATLASGWGGCRHAIDPAHWWEYHNTQSFNGEKSSRLCEELYKVSNVWLKKMWYKQRSNQALWTQREGKQHGFFKEKAVLWHGSQGQHTHTHGSEDPASAHTCGHTQ